MQSYARINGGIVAEILVAAALPQFHPSLVWCACPAEVAVGWTLDGSSFLPPAGEAPAALTERLCLAIDQAADNARRAVAVDPLRAVEYDRARLAAEAFAAAGYQGAVPPMVAAWVTATRNAQQAADSILAEAAAYTAALEQLRTARLQAKEMIRSLMAAEQIEQAEDVAAETIAAIAAAVAGIGNNAQA